VDILDDMGVSKLSAKAFLKVNYSFKIRNGEIAFFNKYTTLENKNK